MNAKSMLPAISTSRVFMWCKENPATALFFIGFFTRVAACLVMRSNELWEFGVIADSILSGKGFSMDRGFGVMPTAYMPPGYTYLVAGSLWLFGLHYGQLVLFAINCITGAAAAPVAWWFAKDLLKDDRPAFFGALLIAVLPVSVAVVTKMHSISTNILILLILSWVCLKWARAGAVSTLVKFSLLAGVLAGLNGYLRGEALLLNLVMFIWVLWIGRKGVCSGKARLASFAGALVVMLIVLSPWIIRNFIELKGFVPTTTGSGYNLWRGHNVNANGGGWAEGRIVDSEKGGPGSLSAAELKEMFQGYDPSKGNPDFYISDFYKVRAIRFIKENPSRELKLAANKLFYFFIVDTNHPLSRKPAYWIWHFVFVWPFVLIALWTGKKQWLGERSLIVLPVMLQALLTVAFFFLPRYRLMVDPYLFMIAGVGIAAVFKRPASPDPAIVGK